MSSFCRVYPLLLGVVLVLVLVLVLMFNVDVNRK